MRKIFFLTVLISFTFSISYGQSIIGVWKNIDDTDGKEKSHIEISEKNGLLQGKIIKLLDAVPITKCDACKGEKKGKNLVGMVILWDLKKEGNTWIGGKILDPKSGKIYDCNIETNGNDKLKVRGYIGISILGRTQTWYRVK